MPIVLTSLLTALLYATAFTLQMIHIRKSRRSIDRVALTLGIVALPLHGFIAWHGIHSGHEFDFSLFKIPALLFLFVNIIFLLQLLRRPLQNQMLIIYPLTALALLTTTFGPGSHIQSPHMSMGLLCHITLSIAAYAILTIAAVQAVLVAIKDYRLRHRRPRGLVQMMPPLQLMETMLMELISVGFVLLTAAIVAGLFFIDDIFAQHLIHKTTLTLLAWLLFAVLLWGHHKLGWRSQRAAQLAIAGFIVLALAFFGSKIALELIISH